MEAIAIDIGEALEKALSSPDHAVRSTAIRYRKLEEEKKGIESFFSMYGQAYGDATVAAAVAAKPFKPKVVTNSLGGGKPDDFVRRVYDVLIAHGRPMRIAHLYEVFFETNVDQTRTAPDTFRQRLFKKRHLIQLIENEGYWPASVPVPASVSVPAEETANVA